MNQIPNSLRSGPDAGGHFGIAERVKRQADLIWSLSDLTFTHEMARLVLAEQLYRVTTILSGHPYHRGD